MPHYNIGTLKHYAVMISSTLILLTRALYIIITCIVTGRDYSHLIFRRVR